MGLNIFLKDPSVSAIVNSASNPEHGITVFFYPLGTGTFHSGMTNELIGTLDSSTANGEPLFQRRTVVNTELVVL